MKKSTLIKTAVPVASTVFAALTAKKKISEFMQNEHNKNYVIRRADKEVMNIIGKLSDKVSDGAIPFLNRYENEGFLEGNGYFLSQPKKGACWRVGFAKASIIPEHINGDLYVGGYLAFPPNKVTGFITRQYVRALALDDGSGRGIHVFAVIDCIGLANRDIRKIRLRLKDFIAEYNILSINISATHCHSGVDTMGLWGDLLSALKTNPKQVKSQLTVNNTVSGQNPEFMDYLYTVAADTIRQAVKNRKKGKLYYAVKDLTGYSHDKRQPFQPDPLMTAIRFEPKDGSKPTVGIMFAAHPTCYGDKQREVSADFPYFACCRLEESGCNGLYFQGAQAAVACDRGKFSPEGATNHESIMAYGKALADAALDIQKEDYTEIEPLLNVLLQEVLIPADNPILTLAGKLRLVQNAVTRVIMESDEYDLCFPTEVGLAELGSGLRFAMIPGEMRPEIVRGGTLKASESYTGTDWGYKPLQEAVNGHLAVIGLCNDEIGYIVPDNDFGSVFAPLHYEESVSAGRRTASNIAAAFLRACEKAEKIRCTNEQIRAIRTGIID